MSLDAIFEKVSRNEPLSRADALELLAIPNDSTGLHRLFAAADGLSRAEYRNRAYLFAQIGINSAPCPGNCKFCSMAACNFAIQGENRLSLEKVVDNSVALCELGVDDLFLMTTADYPFAQLLEIGRAVRRAIPEGMRLVANTGDFGPAQAQALRDAGFTGAYHIRRLGEGVDTDLRPEDRIATMDAIREAGLELYYCVEPVGPEHTAEELADEMLRARDYQVDMMAAMRRIPVPGTPLAARGKITALQLTKIAAVARLVTRPKRSMNVHEPLEMALTAGVNQLYAEYGANPRDVEENTAGGRGFSIPRVREMLRDAEYELGERAAF